MDITVQELYQKLESGEKFIFIDVREPWENEEFNLGAQLMPLGSLMYSLDALMDQKDDEIVVHCRSGARSGQAKMLMGQMGFSNVRNLIGGVMEWQSAFGNTKP